jgi:hypothetical protein
MKVAFKRSKAWYFGAGVLCGMGVVALLDGATGWLEDGVRKVVEGKTTGAEELARRTAEGDGLPVVQPGALGLERPAAAAASAASGR